MSRANFSLASVPGSVLALVAAATLVLIAAIALPCAAHPTAIASANAKIDADGHVHVRFTFDVLAYVLNDTPLRIPNGPMDDLLDGPVDELKQQIDDAAARFSHSFAIFADGATAARVPIDSLKFPSVDDVLAWKRSASSKDSRLPVVLELSLEAHLPPTTRTVAFRFPQVLDQVVMTVERPGDEPQVFALEPGTTSPEVPIALARTATQPTSAPAGVARQPMTVPGYLVIVSAAILIGLMAWIYRRAGRMEGRR